MQLLCCVTATSGAESPQLQQATLPHKKMSNTIKENKQSLWISFHLTRGLASCDATEGELQLERHYLSQGGANPTQAERDTMKAITLPEGFSWVKPLIARCTVAKSDVSDNVEIVRRDLLPQLIEAVRTSKQDSLADFLATL